MYIKMNDNTLNDTLYAQFFTAVDQDDADVVKTFLQSTDIDPSIDNQRAIRDACSFGHSKVVQVLLQDSRVDPTVSNNDCFFLASMNGYLKVVRQLFQDERVFLSLSSDTYNRSIQWAAGYGNYDVLQYLLNNSHTYDRIDLSVEDYHAIRFAMINDRFKNSFKIVRLLVFTHLNNLQRLPNFTKSQPFLDFMDFINKQVIYWVIENRYLDIIRLLFQDPYIRPRLDCLDIARYTVQRRCLKIFSWLINHVSLNHVYDILKQLDISWYLYFNYSCTRTRYKKHMSSTTSTIQNRGSLS